MKDKLKEKIKFTEKELDLLIALAGAFLLDKENSEPWEFDISERIALNNKLRFLKIQQKPLESKK